MHQASPVLLGGIEAGTVDLKVRATGWREKAPLDAAAQAARDLLSAAP